MYQLHERLQQDTFYLGRLTLCDVLLMNDARYPWVILVPRREGVSEIYQLSEDDQQLLASESTWLAKQLAMLVAADKMNIAALGNVVSQLHIHHVARYQMDAAWPAPVWGVGEAVPYNHDEAKAVGMQLQATLSERLRYGG